MTSISGRAIRVLSIGSLYPPHHFGGYEVIWRSAVLALQGRGHQVRVLTSDHRHADGPASEPEGQDVRRELRWYWRDGGWPATGLRERFAIERHNAAVLRRHLDELRPDVVLFSEMGGMSLSLIEQVRRAGLPALGLILDRWPVYGPSVDAWTRAWRRRPILGRLAEAAVGVPAQPDLDHAAEWVFCSTFLRDDVVSSAGLRSARTTVTHPGIDPGLFQWHPPGPWRCRLAYVGRVVPEKGLATAVRAVARLPDADLTVSGHGEAGHLADLRELADRLGAGDRVRFMGRIERGQVPEAYAAADAVLFPVEWDEPFGLVPLEAMAVGRPVIATGTGGSGEYLCHDQNAILFPPGDAEALTLAITRLGEDVELREKIRLGGRATAASHTEETYNATVVEAVERLAASRSGRWTPGPRPRGRLRATAERLPWMISAVGQRFDIGWLTYNPVLIRWYHQRAVADAPAVMRAFERLAPHAGRYADIGSGSGAFAAEAQRRSLEVVACEHGRVGRWMSRRQGVDSRPFDLTREPPADLRGTADLAYCFEVAEHVDPALSDRLVAFLADQAPLVVFTAAHPGQGGIGHVNERPQSYWIERFERKGMRYRSDLSQAMTAELAGANLESRWLLDNLMVFERGE